MSPGHEQEGAESVLMTERIRLVQLSPCCLDYLFGIDGQFDRSRLVDHVVDDHDDWMERP